jgi:diguanylate cyclase (GGDEF)-like protein/PAS domain S-box-containing protein
MLDFSQRAGRKNMGEQGRGKAVMWRSWVKVPDEHHDWFAAKQIRDFHRLSKVTGIGNIFFGFVMLAVAAATGLNWIQGCAVFAVITLTLHRAYRSNQIKKNGPANLDYQAEIQWIERHAMAAGIMLAIAGVLTLILPAQNRPGLAALIIIAAMFVGSWSIDMVPRAAMNFLVGLSGVCAIGFVYIGTPVAFVTLGILLLYALGFVAHARISYNSYALRLLRAKEVEAASETVQLLLNDYEEHGADWLWEIEASGKIINPSDRFAEISGRDANMLWNTTLISLFDDGHERAVLERLLEKGQSFRDVVVNLTIAGEEHWWALSGRPIVDSNGLLKGMRGVATDVSAAKRAEAKVAYMAHYDGLTDLPNRTLFNETLARALSRRPDETLLGILYLDLDQFKTINDTLGHGIGDEVLKVAAKRIESCLGLHDMVARLGGDEFAILLADITSKDQAQKTASDIIEIMSQTMALENHEVNSGVSIGIAFAPDDGLTASELIKNADLALYNAKENGRRRFAIFEIGMHEAMQAKRLIEMDLRAALNRDQLELYYQPLLNIESGEITSYEALLRWNHPEKGMIMPMVFIPIAEETGHIVQLGEWVIRSALMEAARWPRHLCVSVNLSPAQMRSTNLLPTVVNALAASGVDASRLEFEITETVLMHDTQANLAVLHQLRALGIRIALDDFGTGYSSLNYLRSFPFDKIKIDRCFVDEVDSRDDNRAIVRAVTGLATTLGMVTTAEGVERADQLEELRREGCTEVQGYYFSRPVPVAQIKNRTVDTAIAGAKIVALPKQQVVRTATVEKQRRSA